MSEEKKKTRKIKKKNSALIIFIKNPVLGKVKTRIASTEGEEVALKIYIELQRHTRKITACASSDKKLYYDSRIAIEDEWNDAVFDKFLQNPGDLGERINASFIEQLKDYNKVLIIGSDCIQLSTELIDEAITRLDKTDAVIGPTLDGGYYLLGLKSDMPALFENMEWSTESVFSTTMERILKEDKQVFLLPMLSDIDYYEDWEKYGYPID